MNTIIAVTVAVFWLAFAWYVSKRIESWLWGITGGRFLITYSGDRPIALIEVERIGEDDD